MRPDRALTECRCMRPSFREGVGGVVVVFLPGRSAYLLDTHTPPGTPLCYAMQWVIKKLIDLIYWSGASAITIALIQTPLHSVWMHHTIT